MLSIVTIFLNSSCNPDPFGAVFSCQFSVISFQLSVELDLLAFLDYLAPLDYLERLVRLELRVKLSHPRGRPSGLKLQSWRSKIRKLKIIAASPLIDSGVSRLLDHEVATF